MNASLDQIIKHQNRSRGQKPKRSSKPRTTRVNTRRPHPRSPRPAIRTRRNGPSQGPQGYRLLVESIAPTVTKQDLQSLFSAIGPVVRIALSFSSLGRFRGIADVFMRYRKDAVFAAKQFNNQPLDHQRLSVTFIDTSGGGIVSPQSKKNQLRRSNNGKTAKNPKKSKSIPQPKASTDDLNKGLDEFMGREDENQDSTEATSEE